MKNNVSNGLKKIYSTIFIICFVFVISNTCIAAYHEVNYTGSELDIEYQQYNFKEKGNTGELKNALSEIDSENGFPISDFFNYKKFQFWLLIISLATIVIVLSRLSKKLKTIEKEYADKRIKIISKQNQITEKDEIVYGTQESKTIKPIIEENKEKVENIKIAVEQDEKELKNANKNNKVNENVKIIVEDENKEKSISVSIEDTDEDYIFEEDNN